MTGTNFVDTGMVYCMVPCMELNEACGTYRGVTGRYVDETSVQCPVWPLKAVKKGTTYHVNVILDYPDKVDLQR